MVLEDSVTLYKSLLAKLDNKFFIIFNALTLNQKLIFDKHFR